MLLKDIPQGTPVLVDWVDAEGHDGWTKNKKFDKLMAQPIGVVETCGLFHNYVEGSHITILGSRSSSESMHGLCIPLGWIKKVELLVIDGETPVELTNGG